MGHDACYVALSSQKLMGVMVQAIETILEHYRDIFVDDEQGQDE